MLNLSHKTGILFGFLLLILQVRFKLETLAIENIFVILKSQAYWDENKIAGLVYIPKKCLKDNKLTEKGFIRDWYSEAKVEKVTNCSILCFMVSLTLLEENGDVYVPPYVNTTIPKKFPCTITEKNDKCIKAYEHSQCYFGKNGLLRNKIINDDFI